MTISVLDYSQRFNSVEIKKFSTYENARNYVDQQLPINCNFRIEVSDNAIIEYITNDDSDYEFVIYQDLEIPELNNS